MFYNHVFTGLIIMGIGVLMILISWALKLMNLPDILLGFYTGPIVIIIGGGVLVKGENKEK